MLMVPFSVLWRETRRGKSIWRVMLNHVLAQWKDKVNGLVLDLGCGRDPSYVQVLGLAEDPQVRRVGIDYERAFRPTVVADLKEFLPLKDSVADVAIVSSFLYIVPDPKALLGEARRVLKSNGTLLLTAPLVYPHSPEPTDYWRFTEEALGHLLEQAGFKDITIVSLGGRWTAAIYLLSPFLRPRPFVPLLAYWLCLKLDAWTEKRFRLPKCPIGYVARARASA